MKRFSIPLLFLAAAVFGLQGAAVLPQDDIESHRSCFHCGMDRKAYGFSRMMIHYEEGTSIGVCSLRCAVVELDANPGRTVKAILAADRTERTLIDAEKAVWVIGGAKRGVMTDRPKWAFATRTSSEAFLESFGGTIITWNEALAAAREDLAREVR
ncbi:MAG: NosL family protein [Nitrospirae bacterium]|nr:NosL family protein [Nitrospirota bacterium]NTW65899.1 NosL family protein [Nitrospirota bacterium]